MRSTDMAPSAQSTTPSFGCRPAQPIALGTNALNSMVALLIPIETSTRAIAKARRRPGDFWTSAMIGGVAAATSSFFISSSSFISKFLFCIS